MSGDTQKQQRDEIRIAAENDLETFILLVAPYRVLGHVHREVLRWWTREEGLDHQLLLLPRDHGKSALVAYRVAWYIAKYPDICILYLSSTSNLAEKQLGMIKDILTSEIFMYYWPDHVEKEEGKRRKWTNSEIAIDHPKRVQEGIRFPTVFTGGLTTSLTGLHADIVVLDDVVVYENAYTNEGRDKVKSQYSLVNSIAGGDALQWAVGTRYHPKDLYGEMIQMEKEVFDEHGNIVSKEPVYEVFERQVETRGDGTGEFLWPRQQRYDGKWFGFNREILAIKRATYLDRTQYRAQYYNDPNDLSDSPISRDKFQYYDRQFLKQNKGHWFYKDRRLNVFAAIDFAFSLNKRADYTALVVVGLDFENNVYVLDIQRLKTNKISEYFSLILQAHVKWAFRKIRAEVNVAQETIVEELKNSYVKPQGLALSIDKHRPNRTDGAKEERMNATLQPRYDNMQIWHYQGGECQTLEDELVLQKPPHDDVKDALTSAIEIAMPPSQTLVRRSKDKNVIYHPRFGGVSF